MLEFDMKKEVITVSGATRLPYSPAVKAGEYIFVSGQVGFKDAGGKEVAGIAAQTRQCLEKVKHILEEAGASLDDVVKTTVFLSNANHFSEMNEVYRSYFARDYPARSTVVAGPVFPGMLVEIECVAYCASNRE